MKPCSADQGPFVFAGESLIDDTTTKVSCYARPARPCAQNAQSLMCNKSTLCAGVSAETSPRPSCSISEPAPPPPQVGDGGDVVGPVVTPAAFTLAHQSAWCMAYATLAEVMMSSGKMAGRLDREQIFRAMGPNSVVEARLRSNEHGRLDGHTAQNSERGAHGPSPESKGLHEKVSFLANSKCRGGKHGHANSIISAGSVLDVASSEVRAGYSVSVSISSSTQSIRSNASSSRSHPGTSASCALASPSILGESTVGVGLDAGDCSSGTSSTSPHCSAVKAPLPHHHHGSKCVVQ